MARSIKRNALASVLLKVLNIVFPIIVGPYLARTLGEVEYGEFNRAASAIAWFLPFASFGVYNYGIRQISRVRNDKEKLSFVFTCLFVMVFFSTITTSLVYLLYSLLTVDETYHFLYLVSGFQIFSVMWYVEWMNEAFENYDFILIKTAILRVLNIALVFLLVKEADDIVAYAMIISIITFLNYFISFIYIKRKVKFTRIHFSDLKQYIMPLIAMLLLSNSNMLYTALDRLFLSFQENGVLITYYTFSSSLIMMITQVINALIIVTLPRLSKFLGENKKDEYLRLLRLSSRAFFLLGIPMCIGLSCFADAVMLCYGGETYLSAGNTLRLFAVRTLLWMADQSMANQVLFVNGFERKLTKFYFICGTLNLVLNITLFYNHLYLPEYYVITTMISECVLVFLEYRTIKMNIGTEALVIDHHCYKYLLLSLCFLPIYWIGSVLLNYEYILNMGFIFKTLLLIMICILVYFVVLYLAKDSIVFEYMNRVLSRFIKSKDNFKTDV